MARINSAAMTVSLLSLASIANSAGDVVRDPTGSPVVTAVSSNTGAHALKATGWRLRKALNTVYKDLHSHSQEIPNRPDSRDISVTVVRFLPVGISLNDAESILRFAGFSIYPLDLRDGDGNRSPILARAVIYPFERHLFYTYYSSIKVELSQGDIDNRDRVGRIRAEVVMPES